MNDLVSVIVATFNSEDFIIETLESIITQTYKNIEIIITDDNSSDKTLEISKEFLKRKKWDKYKIISSKINTGVPSNLNRGLKAANGTYIKLIAGDDLLVNCCIENNLKFMKSNNNLIQFSNMKSFRVDNKGEKSYIRVFKLREIYNNQSVKKQFNMLLYRNYIYAPTIFLDKKIFEKYGLFNEGFKFLEDYPMWIKISEQGEAIYYLNEETVLYRQHSQSLSHSNKININYFNSFKAFFYDELRPCLIRNKKYLTLIHHRVRIFKDESVLRKNNTKHWYIKLYNLLDPLFIYNKIKSKFILLRKYV